VGSGDAADAKGDWLEALELRHESLVVHLPPVGGSISLKADNDLGRGPRVLS